MLANAADDFSTVGNLSPDILRPASFRSDVIDFVATALPAWRDRADRPRVTSETALTSQICAHLNSTARHMKGWDILQFRVEERDERQAGRTIDLVAAPSGTSITIEGRRHIDFDTLLPIECKRLPTPPDTNRDEMEYVHNRNATTGGIQRFKEGLHGAAHSLGAMIGYVQEYDCAHWDQRIAGWIASLIGRVEGWAQADLLATVSADAEVRSARHSSVHTRSNGLAPISLIHLWIEM